jgi:hypothetical protein
MEIKLKMTIKSKKEVTKVVKDEEETSYEYIARQIGDRNTSLDAKLLIRMECDEFDLGDIIEFQGIVSKQRVPPKLDKYIDEKEDK